MTVQCITESGNPSHLIQPTELWITAKDAAQVLCISYETFLDTFRLATDYHGIRRKLRGTNGCQSARGQGQLFHAGDIEKIRNIRRQVGCHPATAAKVFAAQRRGLI